MNETETTEDPQVEIIPIERQAEKQLATQVLLRVQELMNEAKTLQDQLAVTLAADHGFPLRPGKDGAEFQVDPDQTISLLLFLGPDEG